MVVTILPIIVVSIFFSILSFPTNQRPVYEGLEWGGVWKEQTPTMVITVTHSKSS